MKLILSKDEDEEFWTAYIATTTLEEDADFAGCGQATGWISIAILGGFALFLAAA